MTSTDMDLSMDLSMDVDLDAVLPCQGIRYEDASDEAGVVESCDRAAAWTRRGHCSADGAYCTECKNLINWLSAYGMLRCNECSAPIGPEDLVWRSL